MNFVLWAALGCLLLVLPMAAVEPGVKIQVVGGTLAPVPHDGRPDMIQVFRRLGEMEITSVLVEGGAMVNWACLQSGMVDKIWIFYAPKILGGTAAVPFLSSGFARMNEAVQVKNIVLHCYGDDFAVEGYLRDVYES